MFVVVRDDGRRGDRYERADYCVLVRTFILSCVVAKGTVARCCARFFKSCFCLSCITNTSNPCLACHGQRRRDLRKAVDGLVGRVNGKYGKTDYTPIHYMKKKLSHR